MNGSVSFFMCSHELHRSCCSLNLVRRATQNSQYGNTHFVKANVGKTNRERYGIPKEELLRYSPILGNLKPYAGGQASQELRPTVADDDDLPEGEFKGFQGEGPQRPFLDYQQIMQTIMMTRDITATPEYRELFAWLRGGDDTPDLRWRTSSWIS